jgi:hypothetical protein
VDFIFGKIKIIFLKERGLFSGTFGLTFSKGLFYICSFYLPLHPFQLEQISDEYYAKGFVLGRNALYIHMKKLIPRPIQVPSVILPILHVTILRNG